MNVPHKLGLRVCSGRQAGAVFPLNKSKFIGSQADCEILLSDPAVESVHARIKLRSDGCMIVSLAEKQALKVNGATIRAAALSMGDVLQVGDTALEIIDVSSMVAVRASEAPAEISHGRQEDQVDRRDASEVPTVIARAKGATPARVTMWRYFVYAALGILLVLVTVVCVEEVAERRRQAEMLRAQYRDAAEYAEANPRDYDRIVEKFKMVLALSVGRDRNLESFLRQEVTRVESEKKVIESQFAALVDSLDRKSTALSAKRSYEEALALYRQCDPAFRARVLAERSGRISELENLARSSAEKEKEVTARLEADKKAAKQKAINAEMNKTLADVLDLMIKGDTGGAAAKLQTMMMDGKFEQCRASLDSALTTVELLGSYDRMSKMSVDTKADGAITTNAVPSDEEVPPLVAAVLAMRKGDATYATEKLEAEETHVLKPLLLDVIKASRLAPGKSVADLVALWYKYTGEKVPGTPSPEEFVLLLDKKAIEVEDHDLDRLCKALLKFKENCPDTIMTARYDSLFEMARKLAAQLIDGK
ncbi:MAG: hypothetical protein C0404_04140 [Verrucomicrobia bacterium]|nr:hypothetical protein [Verrucomicrobiota bacterium]